MTIMVVTATMPGLGVLCDYHSGPQFQASSAACIQTNNVRLPS